jgi:hypothetical protein
MFVFVLGAGMISAAGLMIAASILFVVPNLFYFSFPVGVLGLAVSAVGVKEGEREERRSAKTTTSARPTLAAPRVGMRSKKGPAEAT